MAARVWVLLASTTLLLSCARCPNPPVSSAGVTETPRYANSAASAAPATVKDRWKEGKNFDVISTLQRPVSAGGRVEVLEFFEYGCPACYAAEPMMVVWEQGMKPGYVTFLRVPVSWNAGMRAYARLYYTLHQLGREDLHGEVFDTIFRRRNFLYEDDNEGKTLALQLAFSAARGVSEESFRRAFNSPQVSDSIQHADELARRNGVVHTPTFVVDGRYRSDPSRLDRGMYEMLELLTALAERAHEERH